VQSGIDFSHKYVKMEVVIFHVDKPKKVVGGN
jgi:hypothetical protein